MKSLVTMRFFQFAVVWTLCGAVVSPIQAALEAILRWRFKPTFKEDGRAVAQRATLKLMFRLEKPR